jgi:hypothetical protein
MARNLCDHYNLEQVIPCSWNPNQVLEIAAGNVRLDVLADRWRISH